MSATRNPARELVIHIGSRKTGSTSIQAVLAAHADLAREHGVLVPVELGRGEHVHATRYGMGSDEHAAEIALFHDNVRDFLDGGGSTVIVSAESLAKLTVDQIPRAFAPIVDLFDRLRIVLYVRRQDIAAISHYSTRLTGKRAAPSFQPLPRKMKGTADRPYRYATVARDWMAALPGARLDVRKYREKWEGAPFNSVRDFLGIVGLGHLEMPGRSLNTSLGLEGAAHVARANRLFHDGALPAEPAFLQIVHRVARERFDGDGPVRVSRAEAQDFLSRFDDENRALSEMFFDGAPVFSDDFSMYPEAPVDLEALVDRDAMSEILRRAFDIHLARVLPG